MKRLILVFLFSAGLAFQGFAYAQIPHEIAGFELGTNISHVKDKIKADTAMPIRYAEYLTEVEVEPPEGYKSGTIEYGNCVDPGKILKISMKYLDSSQAFYDELLDRFKKKFGQPSEWRGDPFHVYVSWKWSFKEPDGNKISMILQHYTGDEDVYKQGNSVKLTITTAIEQEAQCAEKKLSPSEKKAEKRRAAEEKRQTKLDYQKMNMNQFIPN